MVLVFLDQADGNIKKTSLEAASYGAKVAASLNTSALGIVLGGVKDDLPSLGRYGLKKIVTSNKESLNNFDDAVFTEVIAEAAKNTDAKVVIFSNNFNGKAIAPRLSVRLKAGLVTGAVALPETTNGFTVKKSVFSGKAFANVSIKTDIKIISLNPNAYQATEGEGIAEVEELNVSVPESKVKIKEVNKVTG
jgi:electron transfer flavoprotein alpha subunit